jgi:hypothetical protein
VTSAQTATFLTLLAALALLFLLVTAGVPRVARLLFRCRLEIIRDDCMDAILDDQLREAPSVGYFLRVIETGAAIPRLLTLPRIFALSRALVDGSIDIEDVAPPPSYADLGPDERGIMHRLDARMCDAYASYLNWGSPVSWILRPFVLLVGRIYPGSDIVKAEDALPAVVRETLRDAPDKRARLNPRYGHLFAGR